MALKCSSEQELLDLQARGTKLGLCTRSIRDASVTYLSTSFFLNLTGFFSGRTQIAAGSRTVLGIGPGKQHLLTYKYY